MGAALAVGDGPTEAAARLAVPCGGYWGSDWRPDRQACADDDALGQTLDVYWDYELDRAILKKRPDAM